MGGGDGFGGRDLSPDDPLSGADSTAGWQDLDIDRPGAKHDPTESAGDRGLGDPFGGLDDAPMELPGLELEAVAPKPPIRPAQSAPAAPGATLPGREVVDPRYAAEVAALADYGPPPGGLLGAVPYAVLVITRRAALKKAMADLRPLRDRARADAEEARIELGRALHAQKGMDALGALVELFATADRLGEVAGQRTEAWTRARETAEAQRTSLTEKVAEAEKKAGPYRDQETKLATQMSVRDTDLRRAKARLQRVEIELRNVTADAASDPGRASLLTAERDARAAEVATAQGHVDELAPQLAEARRELAVMLQALNDLEAQRRAVDQAQTRTDKAHLSTAGAAEREYHDAVSALADAALARELAALAAPREAKKAAMMISAAQTRDRELALHDAARSAYDKPAFQRGAAILGGASLIIVAMVLFVVLR